MADKKITALSDLDTGLATGDLFHVIEYFELMFFSK